MDWKDGIHINCVLLATKDCTHVVSIERLAGGTAHDYARHINNSIDHWGFVFSLVRDLEVDKCCTDIKSKMKSSLSDRAPVNPASISLLKNAWNSNIIELSCNLHPLEIFASKVRETLVHHEDNEAKNWFKGTGCLAWKIILNINSVRYSDRKGNVRESFLVREKLNKSILPRVRGNRLNMIFHLGYIYLIYFDRFSIFLNQIMKRNELIRDLQIAFSNESARLEFQIWGILDEVLSGPWMSAFYVSLRDTKSIGEDIDLVKVVLGKLEDYFQHPLDIILCRKDFLGKDIHFDEHMERLMTPPTLRQKNPVLFTSMMSTFLEAIIDVLKR